MYIITIIIVVAAVRSLLFITDDKDAPKTNWLKEVC